MVFSEQGTSASRMAAAKFLDAISRFDGNDGEESDAMGAYTQSELKGPEVPKTWVRLPKHQWPNKWQGKFNDPVVELRLSLYGHPLAGLFWEKHCTKKIMQCGFTPIPGWELLFVHKEKQIFLSVYVDDFKMAGKKENIKPMWKDLMDAGLDLEPPTPLNGGVYLGCGQADIEPPSNFIKQKQ